MADVQIRDTNLKITDILNLLGEGYTHEQIISKHPQITLADIMMSAQIAEEIIGSMVKLYGNRIPAVKMEFIFRNNKFKSIEDLQQTTPRAFAKWNPSEDDSLVSLFKSGKQVKEIAAVLQRSDRSINLRLEKFGLHIQ